MHAHDDSLIVPHTERVGITTCRFHKHTSCIYFCLVVRPMRHHHHLPIRHHRNTTKANPDHPSQKTKYTGHHHRHNQSKTSSENPLNQNNRQISATHGIIRRNLKLVIATGIPVVQCHPLQTVAPVGVHRISTAYSVQSKSENKFGLFCFQNDFRKITFGYYL